MTVLPNTPAFSGCKNFIYACNIDASYADFLKDTTEIIESDCRAFIVDGEIFWNSYSNKTYLQTINEDIVRSHLIQNAHSLFCQINRSNKNVKIQIYMFPYDSAYCIWVSYDALDKTYTISVPKEFSS